MVYACDFFKRRIYLQLFQYFSAVAGHIPKAVLLMSPWREVLQPFRHQAERVILYFHSLPQKRNCFTFFWSQMKCSWCFRWEILKDNERNQNHPQFDYLELIMGKILVQSCPKCFYISTPTYTYDLIFLVCKGSWRQ